MVSLQPLMWKCRTRLTQKKASCSAGANYQITINYQITNAQELQMWSLSSWALHFVLALFHGWPDSTAQLYLPLDKLIGTKAEVCGNPACVGVFCIISSRSDPTSSTEVVDLSTVTIQGKPPKAPVTANRRNIWTSKAEISALSPAVRCQKTSWPLQQN